MGKFRDRMAEDLEIRGYSAQTRRGYLGCVRQFVLHSGRPPDELTMEDIRQYQLYLTRERKVSWSFFNQTVAAIKFFYGVTLKKDWPIQQIPYQRTAHKLPEVPSAEKVSALLSAIQNLKHRAVCMSIYGAGLRPLEATHLKVTDIDSQRMVIRVDQGKGRKDRYTILSPLLVDVLREYWKAYRPKTWLFPGQDPQKPLTCRTLERILVKAKNAANIPGRVNPHLLRHAFATHLLEKGVNIRVIQELLGHASLRSTQIYTHVAANYLQQTPSPLDMLPDFQKAPPIVTA